MADALDRFEAALRDLLQDEARRSVDAALSRLPAGSFGVREVEFEVVIRNLTLETRADPDGDGSSRGRGRPRGAVRAAILAGFDGAGGELTTSAVRAHLEAAGVTTSDDGLHQQLRRLTRAGELVRSGRGRYRRP